MKKTGLKNDKVINFRWDNKGKALVARRAKANEMSKEAYLRLAVEYEAHMRRSFRSSSE